MAHVVAPAILSENSEAYKLAMMRIAPFANRVHIDISDGEFTDHTTITPSQIWWPQDWIADIHAMVSRPEDYLDALMALKPNMIIFHAETTTPLVPIFETMKKNDIRAGLALMRSTVPSSVSGAIAEADHVMIFSGNLGSYGGEANMMQLEKIRLIKDINPKVEIGWDGGVSVENSYNIAQGGVDVLNAGGAFANSEDPMALYQNMVREINKTGVM